MEALSQMYSPSSRSTGTSRLGFMAANSGVSSPPKGPPASMRSCATPSSANAHMTVCTFDDVVLPQTVIMSLSPGKTFLFFEHVEVHVVAHVALRRLLQRLEFPRVVGAVAQRRVDHPAGRLAGPHGGVERRHVPARAHLFHERGNKGSICRFG